MSDDIVADEEVMRLDGGIGSGEFREQRGFSLEPNPLPKGARNPPPRGEGTVLCVLKQRVPLFRSPFGEAACRLCSRYNILAPLFPLSLSGRGLGEGGRLRLPTRYLQRLMSRLMGQQQGD